MGKAAQVIAANLDAARTAADEIAQTIDYSPLGTEGSGLCTGLLETVADPRFPGAIVPALDGNDLNIYVATPSAAAWRRLSPVLRAFSGPTLSSFDGLPQPLPSTSPTAAVIARLQPTATSLMRLPRDPKSRISALRSLARARDTLARAPDLQRSAPEPTSWLLARFQDYLNVGRRDAAAAVLGRLASELRLDALNLKFLEVQLLATFDDWAGITQMTGFASLCMARRTPATTAFLLEALFQVHLANAFQQQDRTETRSRFESIVRPLAHPMLALPAPPTLTAPGWRLYGLESWVNPSRTDLISALVDQRGALGWIADEVPGPPPIETSTPSGPSQPLDGARTALVEVDNIETIDSLSAARAALARLRPDELEQLRIAEPFKAAVLITEQAAELGLPSSWVDWLAMAAEPTFTSALDLANRGKDEWPIGQSASDPVAVQALVAGLNSALDNGLAAERTAQALPFLVAWLRRDPDFPRPGMAPLYASLLTLFALGSARGRVTYESSQLLINGLLSAGLNGEGYRSLIADVEELASDGFGIDMTYWLLEVIEDFMRAGSPDNDARQSFLHRSLARISPIFGRLSDLQRVAVARLAGELGWLLQSFGIASGPEASKGYGSRMDGLRIAIYSLTETSSRQAKAAIEQAAPSAIVDCSADHGGTPRLKAMAENADLFVMTWLSAKHAATDFIREHRGNRPLLYAQGRGFSSILRALDEHFASARP